MRLLHEKEVFRDRLRSIVNDLIGSRTGVPAITGPLAQEVRELVSVLSEVRFDGLGKVVHLTGARFAIELLRVEDRHKQVYVFVVWGAGNMQVIDPNMQVIDLGVSV